VIPLYNHEGFIEQAIRSVLSQTTAAAELIVVDDGSSDGSADRMRRLCAEHPEIIFWSWPNQGAHRTLNAALLRATGEFVAILNSDDYYDPQRLAACLDAVRADPSVDVVVTAVSFADAQATRIVSAWHDDALSYYKEVGDISLALFHANFLVTTSNFFVRRSVFERVGYFSPLRYAHDLEFALRLVAARRTIRFVDRPLVTYRIHGRNTIGQDTGREDVERAAIYAFFLHRQRLAGRIDEAILRRHVEVLGHQHLLEVVEHFLALLEARQRPSAAAVSDRLAAAFLDYQEHLGIDWLSRDTGDPVLDQFVVARNAFLEQQARIHAPGGPVDELKGRIAELVAQRDALEQEWQPTREWLTSQCSAWEKVAIEYEGQVNALNVALQEMKRGKDWLAEQRDAWENVAAEYKAQAGSLNASLEETKKGKDWLAEQRDAWEKVADEYKAQVTALNGALDRQARAASDAAAKQDLELAALRQGLAESRAKLEALQAQVDGLLRSRLFRLLLRARLLRLPRASPNAAAEGSRTSR
jgi:glycosyltransferase involved in cell wall biosynthesis